MLHCSWSGLHWNFQRLQCSCFGPFFLKNVRICHFCRETLTYDVFGTIILDYEAGDFFWAFLRLEKRPHFNYACWTPRRIKWLIETNIFSVKTYKVGKLTDLNTIEIRYSSYFRSITNSIVISPNTKEGKLLDWKEYCLCENTELGKNYWFEEYFPRKFWQRIGLNWVILTIEWLSIPRKITSIVAW